MKIQPHRKNSTLPEKKFNFHPGMQHNKMLTKMFLFVYSVPEVKYRGVEGKQIW